MAYARPFLRHLAVLAILAASAGCGYTLAGRGSFLPEHIQSISVPPFKNTTAVPEVDRRITERVVAELIGRGKYRVLTGNETGDALLSGEISSINISPTAFNQEGRATRYALVLTARIDFRDLKTNKLLWSNPGMQFKQDLEMSGVVTDPAAFFGQDTTAMEKLANEFARTVVSAILEAF